MGRSGGIGLRRFSAAVEFGLRAEPVEREMPSLRLKDGYVQHDNARLKSGHAQHDNHGAEKSHGAVIS